MRAAAAALGVAALAGGAAAQDCSPGQRQAYADEALAFRFRPSGISGGGGNDRTLAWAAEDEGDVGGGGGGMVFQMIRAVDPLANLIGTLEDEGEFIEPCLASTGCPEFEESCYAIDPGTSCVLTPAVPDDPGTEDNEFVAGFCTPVRGGRCGHQPPEVAQAALSPELGGLYWESGDGAPYEMTLYSDKKIAIGAAHTAFFVFTHADSAAPWAAFMGFRPSERSNGRLGLCRADGRPLLRTDNGPGVFAFNVGSCESALRLRFRSQPCSPASITLRWLLRGRRRRLPFHRRLVSVRLHRPGRTDRRPYDCSLPIQARLQHSGRPATHQRVRRRDRGLS